MDEAAEDLPENAETLLLLLSQRFCRGRERERGFMVGLVHPEGETAHGDLGPDRIVSIDVRALRFYTWRLFGKVVSSLCFFFGFC